MTQELSPKLLLSGRETAALLRLSQPTLERMRVDGSGPPFIKLGAGKRSRVAYALTDLEVWIASRRFARTADYRGA